MTQVISLTPWFERRFHFDAPAGLFPVFVERITGTPARIEEMVAGAADDLLAERPAGKWSVKDHVGHLADLEKNLHGPRLEQFFSGTEVLHAADVENRFTWEQEHFRKPIGVLLQDFRKVRKEFMQRLQEADEAVILRSALHPRLQKPMRLIDMIFFMAEHDDQHLAIMRTRL